jgi:hypothetical protein
MKRGQANCQNIPINSYHAILIMIAIGSMNILRGGDKLGDVWRGYRRHYALPAVPVLQDNE